MMALDPTSVRSRAIARAEAARRTCFTLTESGRAVLLASPSRDAININDIAAHLAKQTLWLGATQTPYSAAQRAVLTARRLAAKLGAGAALHGLIADASDAYVGVVSPQLREMAAAMTSHDVIGELRRLIHAEIVASLGLDWPGDGLREAIVMAREAVTAAEARDLLPAPPKGFRLDLTDAGSVKAIRPWPWPKSLENYLTAWRDYYDASGAGLMRRAAE